MAHHTAQSSEQLWLLVYYSCLPFDLEFTAKQAILPRTESQHLQMSTYDTFPYNIDNMH